MEPGAPDGIQLGRVGRQPDEGDVAWHAQAAGGAPARAVEHEHGLPAPSRVGSPRGPRSHDGTIIPDTVDTMWGTDLTATITDEGEAAVFAAADHCSAECVGFHAARHANRFEARKPLRQGVRPHFGAFAQEITAGLAVRHDRGLQRVSDALRSCTSLASKARPPSHRRAAAARSASSAPSRKTCSGSGSPTPSSSCAGRCPGSARPTTRPGSSSGLVSGRPAPPGRIGSQPQISPHRLQLGVSASMGGTSPGAIRRRDTSKSQAPGAGVQAVPHDADRARQQSQVPAESPGLHSRARRCPHHPAWTPLTPLGLDRAPATPGYPQDSAHTS